MLQHMKLEVNIFNKVNNIMEETKREREEERSAKMMSYR